MQIKKYGLILLFVTLIVAVAFLFPWLFEKVVLWQREFNQLLSESLHKIKDQPIYTGLSLIAISFIYGVFHALGPGHGKFIITGYLSTHQSKLAESMRLSFLSSLMQGIVAITATSVIVLLLQLSSAQFKLSQLWLERVAYALIFLLGLQWLKQSGRAVYLKYKKPQIRQLTFSSEPFKLGKSAVQNSQDLSCGCGHQHMPSSQQLAQANTVKSQWLIIFSIGMRPCTGAVFVLFLAYMLDLYLWGMIATMAMAVGTGMTLSAFALLVQYARQTAVKLGKWYASPKFRRYFSDLLKLAVALFLILASISLIYTTFLPKSGGSVLFS